MEAIMQLGIQIIVFLQNLGSWLLLPMKAFTFLGNEDFFLFVAPLVFWCIDAQLGLRLALTLMISGALNSTIKIALRSPRPYWISPQVHAYVTETSFGIPSGHAQHAVVVWGQLAVVVKRTWFWCVALALIFLIGVSRIYLGVHFPHDVLIGWIIGGLLFWLILSLEKRLTSRLQRMAVVERIQWAFGVSLAILLLGSAADLGVTLSGWVIPSAWVQLAARAAPEAEIISPLSLDYLISSAGVFFGMALGAILIFARGGFDAGGPYWQRGVRFIIGVLGVAILRYGLKAIFPSGDALGPYFLRYLRYALIGVWITGLAPFLFIRLKLAKTQSRNM